MNGVAFLNLCIDSNDFFLPAGANISCFRYFAFLSCVFLVSYSYIAHNCRLDS